MMKRNTIIFAAFLALAAMLGAAFLTARWHHEAKLTERIHALRWVHHQVELAGSAAAMETQ